ncbi:MAG TPA: 5'-nucleotidase C-terminal domain-containing protein, partial [Actinomycetota bacterium]|nr:5'-nucleotidase C-terminal domain-containing protein [Actinomycetota bacterium]
GVATDVFPRGGNVERLQEVAIGNLIADSMRLRYGTQIAFTNGGGIRAPLPSSYLPEDTTLRRTTAGYAPGPPYDLVVGDVFTVLPFGNVVVTRTVTGALLYQTLEKSVEAIPGANGRFLQISGFRFTYDAANPVGSRVVSVELTDGTPVLPDGTTYTAATNDFVNTGGDGYSMLADGTGVTREVMADVLVEHIRGLGTISPVIEGRIIRLN